MFRQAYFIEKINTILANKSIPGWVQKDEGCKVTLEFSLFRKGYVFQLQNITPTL